MIYRPPIDEETKAAAIKAFKAGHRTLTEIAKHFGVTVTTLRMWTDPDYKRARMDRINKARRAKEGQ